MTKTLPKGALHTHNDAASYVTCANIHPQSMYGHIHTLQTQTDDPTGLKKVKKPAKNCQKLPKPGPKQLKNSQNALKQTKSKLKMV